MTTTQIESQLAQGRASADVYREYFDSLVGRGITSYDFGHGTIIQVGDRGLVQIKLDSGTLIAVPIGTPGWDRCGLD